MKSTNIEIIGNEFKLTTSDDIVIDELLEYEYDFNSITPISNSTYIATFSISLLLEEGFAWLEKIFIENGFEHLLNEISKTSNTLKEIKEMESHFDEEDYFYNNEEFLDYKNYVLNKMDGISDTGEFANITKKQLFKTFIYSRLNNVANFSEPGTGKTVMSLMTFFSKERTLNKNLRLVIICPINAINVWREEIIKFTNIDEKEIHIYRDDFNELNHNFFSHDTKRMKVVILNYESVQNLVKNGSAECSEPFNGDFVIYDEVHRIKSGGKYYKQSYKLAEKWSSGTIILTGTPYSNNIEEVENIFKLNWQGQVPTISNVKFQDYNIAITNKNYDVSKVEQFKGDLSPYYFRLKKRDDFNIKDAQDKYNEPIEVKALSQQRKIDLYIKEEISKTVSIIHNGKAKVDMSIRNNLEKKLYSLISFAQMNSVNPKLLKGSDFMLDEIKIDWGKIPEFKELPKIKESLNLVKDITSKGEKVIVWMRYRSNIEDFNSLLISSGIKSSFIHGKVQPLERTVTLEKFNNEDDDVMVLVTNPDTLAESISLHKHVHQSIFIERGFSYYQWMQAKDRIHRVGTPENKTVTHHYLKSSELDIDNKIFKNLNEKKNIDDMLFRDLITIDDFSQNTNTSDYTEILFNAKEEYFKSGYNISKEDSNSFDKYDEYINI